MRSAARFGWLVVLAGLVGGCSTDEAPGTLPTVDIPVDDVITADSDTGGDQPFQCLANVQCAGIDGVDACHEGRCDRIAGECTLWARPGCCVADEDCDDGDGDTADVCDPELNVCKFTDTAAPCDTDAQCPPPEACTTSACEGFCTVWKTPGCCAGDEDCDDGDGCTVDRCQGEQCVHPLASDPICCGDVLSSLTFGGDGETVEIETNDQAAIWHQSSERSHSPPSALRFADPETGSYMNPIADGEVPASWGRATLPPMDLPSGAELTLTFWLYLDLAEKQVEYDQLSLELYTNMSSVPVVWDKSALTDEDYERWVKGEVDLSPWAGQTVRAGFVFDTLDGTVNNGEGVFIDDVLLVQGCTDTPVCAGDEECDDGNACTTDRCVGGQCQSAPSGECCQTAADCSPPPPVACVEALCVEGQCEVGPIPGCCVSDEECNDGDTCTVDRCDVATSTCESEPLPDCCDPAQCDDGNPCTVDACGDSGCTHELLEGCGACVEDEDCPDDDNPCTFASCYQGQCLYVPEPNCNPCNGDGDCADGNDCTEDICNSGQCIYAQLPGCVEQCESVEQCGDGDPCTADFCIEGACQHLEVPGCQPGCQSSAQCDDGDACTADFCEEGECANLPIPGCGCPATGCNDNDPCTGDTCHNGQCVFTPHEGCCLTSDQCDDGNPCTADACDAATNVCQHAPLAGCCLQDDQCDDDNACTVDSCGANGTCKHAPITGCCATNAACDDGNACTADSCVNGVCAYAPKPECCTNAAQCGDGNPCTTDSCVDGGCVHAPSSAAGCCTTAADCEDGDGCTTHTCTQGVCATKVTPDCCEADIDCEDGLACSTNTCVNGSCQTEQAPGCCFGNASCTDGILCTVDSCNNDTGQCQYIVLPGCCTLDSQCDDGDPCTLDTCGSNNYCAHEPIEGCCATDSDCGGAGECQQAQCLGNQCFVSEVPGCCTTDAACDDGNPCTTDACQGGACTSSALAGCCTTAAQCDDGDECTSDGCQGGACTHVEDPECGCSDQVVLSQAFSGPLTNWIVQGNGAAKWQVSSLRAQSPPSSLWFGNANTGDFSDPGGGASTGRIASPVFTAPAGKGVLLKFSAWLDVETNGQFDVFDVRVRTAGQGQGTVVWSKQAVPANLYQSWVDVQVNLSAYAGQPIRVVFAFASVDPVQNNGQGIFVDDFGVVSACDPVEVCSFDGECSDGDGCTADLCVSGTCQNSPIPGCCASDTQCDDNYVCTVDQCTAEGECVHELQEGCCQFDAECEDGSECTASACVGNVCVAEPTNAGGCCATDAECDDGNACTIGACEDFACVYEVSTGPGCCEASTLLSATFDNATKQGFTTIGDGSASTWSVQNKRFFSPPFSLYFGVPGEWVVSGGDSAYGQAISPSIQVPVTASAARLTFRTWWQLDQPPFGEPYRLSVLSGTTLKEHWASSDVPQAAGQWIKVTVDLSEYKGKTIQLYWIAQIGGEPFGALGEGIYLDSVEVETTCE